MSTPSFGPFVACLRAGLLITTLDADENPGTARAYRVLSLPTLLMFTNGVLTGTLVGARPKSVLRQTLSGILAPYANV